jgi:hypothetical protein
MREVEHTRVMTDRNALIVVEPSNDLAPGVIHEPNPKDRSNGFFVTYRLENAGRFQICQALIAILVADLSEGRSFSGHIPFLIDSGSPVTIIPRALVPAHAFRRSTQVKCGAVFLKILGGSFCGHYFRASLAITTTRADIRPLSIGKMGVFVVEAMHTDYGILGLDAMRRVQVRFDAEIVSLWPATGSLDFYCK